MASSRRDPLVPLTFVDSSNELLEEVEEISLQRRSRHSRHETIPLAQTIRRLLLMRLFLFKLWIVPNFLGGGKFNPDVYYADVFNFSRCNFPSTLTYSIASRFMYVTTLTYSITSRFMYDLHFPASYEIFIPRSGDRIYN